MQIKKEKSQVFHIVEKEFKKIKSEKLLVLSLVTILILTLAVLMIIFLTSAPMTGFASYVYSKAGYITEIQVTSKIPTNYWHGIYGLALRVPDFTEQLYQDMKSGEIARQDIFLTAYKKMR
jgi:hypothetical protein